MTTIQPIEQPAHWLVTGAAENYTGITRIGELTGVDPNLTATFGEGEMAALEAMMAQASAFPELPESGWLEQDDIYQWGATLVMVRQSHNRTQYSPDETPALFIVYREDAAEVLEWIAGEQVHVGTRRVYDGVEYECLQAHVTQSDWTPPAVPALWRAVVEPSDEWQAGTAYTIGDVVSYLGVLYECRQSHTSQPGWEPPNVPALWLAL
jgi:hypothetical protein